MGPHPEEDRQLFNVRNLSHPTYSTYSTSSARERSFGLYMVKWTSNTTWTSHFGEGPTMLQNHFDILSSSSLLSFKKKVFIISTDFVINNNILQPLLILLSIIIFCRSNNVYNI